MSKECQICGNRTIFFVWSSTRDFPRDDLLKIIGKKYSKRKKENILLGRDSVPICFNCARKLGYKI